MEEENQDIDMNEGMNVKGRGIFCINSPRGDDNQDLSRLSQSTISNASRI